MIIITNFLILIAIAGLARISQQFKRENEQLNRKLNNIMATQAELADELNIVNTQVQKIGEEISGLKTKIDELESVINAGGDVSPEVRAALDRVKESVQVADDLVPDAEPVPPIP